MLDSHTAPHGAVGVEQIANVITKHSLSDLRPPHSIAMPTPLLPRTTLPPVLAPKEEEEEEEKEEEEKEEERRRKRSEGGGREAGQSER